MLLTTLIAGAISAAVIAPPACDEAGVTARVVEYLGGAEPPPADVKTRLQQHDDIWTIQVRIGDAEREFSAPQCATVIDAAAFVIAVTIDPSVAGRPVPPADAAPVTPVTAVPQPSRKTGPIDATPSPPRPSRIGMRFGAEFGVDFGALPLAGLLLRPSIGIGGRHFTASAIGAFRTRARARNADDPSAGGDIGAWSLGARGCWTPKLGQTQLSLPACGAVESGQVFAKGFGFSTARSTTLPWLGLTVSAGLALALPRRFALIARVELGGAPLGGELFIEGLGPVHTLRRVFGRATVGIQFGLGGPPE